MAVVVTVSLSFGHLTGTEHGQRILPHFLRLRRGRQIGEQIFQAAGMVGGQQKCQIVTAPDTPTAPSAFHPVSNECVYVALHAAKSRVVDLARRIGIRDLNAALVRI